MGIVLLSLKKARGKYGEVDKWFYLPNFLKIAIVKGVIDEELRRLLNENLEVSKETLKITKKMNRARVWGSVFSFLKWVVIIGVSVGSFYYIEPMLQKTLETLTGAMDEINQVKKVGESIGGANNKAVQDLLKKVQQVLPAKK